MNSRSFFFNDTATTEIYTLSLHDALPIWSPSTSTNGVPVAQRRASASSKTRAFSRPVRKSRSARDRKSTRLNSSHSQISYAVFCLKKKNVCLVLRRSTARLVHQLV